MNDIRHSYILSDVADLCHEVLAEINQQLLYYNASVYKQETAQEILNQIHILRILTDLISKEDIRQAFLDYDNEAKNPQKNYTPGECSFTTRVSKLLRRVSPIIEDAKINLLDCNEHSLDDIKEKIFNSRNTLLSLCRHGSRQWSFLQQI